MVNRHPPFSFLVLAMLAILVAGPGSPFCTAARAATLQGMAMPGCDKPGPIQKHDAAAHPDCASPCIAMDCPAPELGAPLPGKRPPPSERVQSLKGIYPGPEPDPPRSNWT